MNPAQAPALVITTLLASGLLAACGADRKPAPEPIVIEPAIPGGDWEKEAARLLAIGGRAHDEATRSAAIRELGAFADRAPPADVSPQVAAETRQKLYVRAAELAFDAGAPARALRLAKRGLRAEGGSRVELLGLLARAKRALGDEAGAVEAETEAQSASK